MISWGAGLGWGPSEWREAFEAPFLYLMVEMLSRKWRFGSFIQYQSVIIDFELATKVRSKLM